MTTAAENDAAGARVGRYRWVVVGLLFAAMVINYVDRQTIGLLKGNLTKAFGWSETNYGDIVFWFQASYAVSYLAFGRIVDRVGARWGFGLAFLIWQVAHIAHAGAKSLNGFIAAHRRRPSGHAITMLGFHTDTPRSCGILELDGRNTVVAFHEKVDNPPGNLANGAVYLFEPEVVETIASFGRPIVDLSTEIIPHYVGRILCIETRGYHRDIGTPESLARAIADMTPLSFSRANVA